MGRNHCHPALKNDSGLALWCPRGSKSGSLLLQNPLGKRERTHAHSPVLGVQANLIAFRDACTFCHRPSACEGSPIAKFRDSLNWSNGQRIDVRRANRSNDAKTSGVRMSSLRQRSTASARTAGAFFSSSVSERSPFIAMIDRVVPSHRIECPARVRDSHEREHHPVGAYRPFPRTARICRSAVFPFRSVH